MTPFREWKDGAPFEMMDPVAGTRYGVKLPVQEFSEAGEKKKVNAFFFDTNTSEFVSHNKKVSPVRAVRGRLARTHDNRLIVVNQVKNGVWSAYYVNLAEYKTLHDTDFDMIPVEVGKRQDEVDIILKKLRKSLTKADIYLKELELDLFE